MAYASTHASSSNLLETLARPFVAVGNFLAAITEANSMAQEANRIANMSDEALEAQGLTREQAIQKMFAPYAHL